MRILFRKSIDTFIQWVPGLRLIISRLRSFCRKFMPKVGILEQYPPRGLSIPRAYLTILNAQTGKPLPSIAIVTPSYNQGEFIERTIRSVLDQKYPHLEYIVQDGNSQDGTLDVLKSFQEKLTYDSRQDNGQVHRTVKSHSLNGGCRTVGGWMSAGMEIVP